MYEAKILKTEHWDESNTKNGEVGPHFFVHYKGWKQTSVYYTDSCILHAMLIIYALHPRWDEWVDRSRLLKHSDTNLNLQKSLQQANAAATAAQLAASAGAGASAKGAGYVNRSSWSESRSLNLTVCFISCDAAILPSVH